jgi:hypothetical protein
LSRDIATGVAINLGGRVTIQDIFDSGWDDEIHESFVINEPFATSGRREVGGSQSCGPLHLGAVEWFPAIEAIPPGKGMPA